MSSRFVVIVCVLLGAGFLAALGCGEPSGLQTGASGARALHAASFEMGDGAWCGDAAEDPALRFLPLSAALQVLPPLGDADTGRREFDRTLGEQLAVVICRVDGTGVCTPVAEFTAGASQRHRGEVALAGNHYQVNWALPDGHVEADYEIHFSVADVAFGWIDYASSVPRTLPIKFTVAPHPIVRGAVLAKLGVPVTGIAERLSVEFDLDVTETVWVLRVLGYGVEDLHLVLSDTFGIGDVFELERIFDELCVPPEEYLEITALGPIERFAPALRFDRAYWGLPMSAQRWFDEMLCSGEIPYDAADGYDYLACSNKIMEYGFLVYCLDDITRNLCEIPRYVWGNPPPAGAGPGSKIPQAHTPLRALVDSERSCDPRSPEGLCCQWEIFHAGWSCTDSTTWGTEGPQGGPDVPTYYTVMSNAQTGALRIVYWWYYGYQPPCNWTGMLGKTGEHVGDWERIMVTTTPDRSAVDAVTYFQHGGWYTRWRSLDGFQLVGERPVVYVGKANHGSYHNQRGGCGGGGISCCCYWWDPRNPPTLADGSVDPEYEWDTSTHLVSLRGDEPWMVFERGAAPSGSPIADWRWGPSVGICGEGAGGSCLDKKWVTAISGHPTLFAPLNKIAGHLQPPNEENLWCITLCRGTDPECNLSGTNQQGCSGHNQDALALTQDERDRWGAWCDSYAAGDAFALRDIDW